MISSTQNFENNTLILAHPKATYKKVVEDKSVFMETLEDLLEAIGTKFRVPDIAGKPLDLHRLFVEVSIRGGIQKVIADGRWSEVTSLFTFPPTTPSAPFYIRSHYIVFLLTYEEFYLFRGKQRELPLNDAKANSISLAFIPAVPVMHSRAVGYNIPETEVDSVSQASIPVVPNLHSRAVNYNISDVKVERISEASIPAVPNLHSGAVTHNVSGTKVNDVSEGSILAAQDLHTRAIINNTSGAKINDVSEGSIPAVPDLHSQAVINNTSGQRLLKVGNKVRGKMNGKFENGYTITATIGSEVMHGVLYLVPVEQQAQPLNSRGNSQKRSRNDTSNSELKSNDKGYDLFLTELYPRIAPFYPGQEEVAIRHIKSLWDKRSEFEQKVYQDKATSKRPI